LMDQLEKSAEGWKLSNLAQLRCKLRPRWIQLHIHSLQSCFIYRHSSTVLASVGTGSQATGNISRREHGKESHRCEVYSTLCLLTLNRAAI
jgi:hypothetical protein